MEMIVVQWKYCDFCGNISLKSIDGKKYKCPRCDWEGYPREGSMESVNAKARAYRSGTKWLPPAPLYNESNGEETPDFGDNRPTKAEGSEFAAKIRSTQGQNLKIPKNQELLQRLKGKGFGDGEFI